MVVEAPAYVYLVRLAAKCYHRPDRLDSECLSKCVATHGLVSSKDKVFGRESDITALERVMSFSRHGAHLIKLRK